MLITNTYVRFVPAQTFYAYLEPSQDTHIHVVSVLFRRAAHETLVCALYQKHMFHAHLESDSTDQTDILGSTFESTYAISPVGVWYLKRHVLEHASLGQKSFSLLSLVIIIHNFNLSITHISFIPDFLHT